MNEAGQLRRNRYIRTGVRGECRIPRGLRAGTGRRRQEATGTGSQGASRARIMCGQHLTPVAGRRPALIRSRYGC